MDEFPPAYFAKDCVFSGLWHASDDMAEHWTTEVVCQWLDKVSLGHMKQAFIGQ